MVKQTSEADLGKRMAEYHSDSITLALQKGYLMGMRDVFRAVLGDGGVRSYQGTVPPSLIAWCREALANIEKVRF